METLRTFRNLNSAQLKLEKLESSFSKSYDQSIERHATRNFVSVYQRDGFKISRSFAEFDKDVKLTSQFLLSQFHQYSVLATRAGNCYEHLVFIAAILRSGFQFCPLNPNDSRERTDRKIQSLPPSCKVLEKLEIPKIQSTSEIAPKARDPKEPFIFVFTSGSTGYSKVVQQSEFGVLSNVEALLKHHQLGTEPSVIATPLPIFHVNALEFSFFATLLGGHELVLFESFDLMQVFRCFQEKSIQIFSAVPHLLFLISQQIQKFSKLNLKDFRYFVSAAGPLPLSTLDTFARHGLKVIQGYGLSEAVNFSLITPITFSISKIKSLAEKAGRPSVGVPVWGNEVQILKEDLTPCAPGGIGEVCVRGVNVMLGYRNESGNDIFAGDWLHTGDLGFYLDDTETGEKLFFVTGRLKDIAKKYGSTVSLVELDETVLGTLPPGVDAISVNFENLRAGEELGLVLRNTPQSFDVDSFAKDLIQRLSREMRPQVIALTDESLRTESGKPLRWTFRQCLKDYLDTQTSHRDYFLLDLRRKGP